VIQKEYNKKYESNSPELCKSILEGTKAAAEMNIGGVLRHAGTTGSTAQTLTQNTRSDRRFEQQRNLLIVKLREGQTRLVQGKTSMGMFGLHTITGTVEELESLEKEVNQGRTWETQTFNSSRSE